MKKLLCLVFLLSTFVALAQKGNSFPSIKGITLDDKQTSLPAKNGKYSVVAIAFNRGAEDDLKKWLNPLCDSFLKTEKSGNADMGGGYDVNFVFIPMIAGFKKIADEFKSGTDKQFWPYIMDTEKTDIKALQKQLGVTDNKIPYFYVLDKDGKIVETESGRFTNDKLDKLEEAVDQ